MAARVFVMLLFCGSAIAAVDKPGMSAKAAAKKDKSGSAQTMRPAQAKKANANPPHRNTVLQNDYFRFGDGTLSSVVDAHWHGPYHGDWDQRMWNIMSPFIRKSPSATDVCMRSDGPRSEWVPGDEWCPLVSGYQTCPTLQFAVSVDGTPEYGVDWRGDEPYDEQGNSIFQKTTYDAPYYYYDAGVRSCMGLDAKDETGFKIKSSDAASNYGIGTITATKSCTTQAGTTLRIDFKYTLSASDSRVAAIEIEVAALDGDANGAEFSFGTADDYFYDSDDPMVRVGTADSSGFTNAVNSTGNAVHVSENPEDIEYGADQSFVLWSNHPGTRGHADVCCNLRFIVDKDPETLYNEPWGQETNIYYWSGTPGVPNYGPFAEGDIAQPPRSDYGSDASYGINVHLGNIKQGESACATVYMGTGLTADLGSIIAEASLPANNIACGKSKGDDNSKDTSGGNSLSPVNLKEADPPRTATFKLDSTAPATQDARSRAPLLALAAAFGFFSMVAAAAVMMYGRARRGAQGAAKVVEVPTEEEMPKALP